MIDYSNGSYCFDYRVIWREVATGRLLTARDSGCSCPSPFEDYGSVESLAAFVLSEIEEEVLAERRNSYYQGDDPAPFLEKIRALAATVKEG